MFHGQKKPLFMRLLFRVRIHGIYGVHAKAGISEELDFKTWNLKLDIPDLAAETEY
jgi:hypothetical protein